MKYIMIDIDEENERVAFVKHILGNYSLESFFGNFPTHISPHLSVDGAGYRQHTGGLPDVKSQLYHTPFGVRSPSGVSTQPL